MKQLSFVIISALLLLSNIISAKAQDTLITHNNDTLLVTIVEVTDGESIKFKYPGEELINNMPFSGFEKINLKSGRTITGEERITINGVEDFEKVILTYNPEDVKGLVEVQEISSTATSKMLGAYGSLEKAKKSAKIGLQKKAAQLGCHIVLITEDNSRDGNTRQAFKYTKGSFTGIAYKYKEL